MAVADVDADTDGDPDVDTDTDVVTEPDPDMLADSTWTMVGSITSTIAVRGSYSVAVHARKRSNVDSSVVRTVISL